jgi:hypothetical protein
VLEFGPTLLYPVEKEKTKRQQGGTKKRSHYLEASLHSSLEMRGPHEFTFDILF